MAVAFGRYQLLKKIASGGMGQVFLAQTAQAGFEKLVVLKRILPNLVEDEEFLQMFFDEAKIAARLNHPNLAQIFELSDVEGMHYLAMEYVQGDDVRRVEKTSRRSEKPLPLGVICRIIADAAAGLDYAHKLKDATGKLLNLIHRDVSPQNILVGFDGGVKLIDFGVARAAGRAQHTATGILKGKYPYMSPEQIAGEEYDHRSDQFALAIVFWELLTGRRLFKGDSDLVTMRLVRECNVPLPSTLNAALPRGLDDIVLKALAAKPQLRFADTGAFRMAIEDLTVDLRLPATPAHLAAYMRDLYSERIEAESDLSSLDELSGPSAFDEDSASKPSNSRAGAQAPVTMPFGAPRAATAAASASGGTMGVEQKSVRGTRALTRPGARSGGLGAPIIVGAALAVIAAAVGVPLFLKSGERVDEVATAKTPSEAERAPPVVVEADPPQPVVVTPKPVEILLVSAPPGAAVAIDGTKIGITPVAWAMPSSNAAVNAVFTLEGHEPTSATLTPSSAPTMTVQLKRQRPVAPAKHQGTKPTLGIKTGR